MPIKVSIVEDLAEVRKGLAELVSSDKELLMMENFDNAESAIEKLPGAGSRYCDHGYKLAGYEWYRMHKDPLKKNARERNS